jgi:undecaprenyl-diphosphatase
LCEFLPVSSSGHLVLAQALFHLEEPEVLLDLVLHLGTLLAVCVFYRRSLTELVSETRLIPEAVFRHKLAAHYQTRPVFHLGVLIIAASIPTALIGLLAQDFLESLFNSVRATGLALLGTAAVLSLTRLIKTSRTRSILEMTLLDAFLIGTIQGLAIAPGLSRSGLTISCALILGLNKELSARFSFLLSIPAIVGGLALSLGRGQTSSVPTAYLFLGLVVSGVVGYLSLRFLTYIVDRGKLSFFAPWCLCVGLLALFWSF